MKGPGLGPYLKRKQRKKGMKYMRQRKNNTLAELTFNPCLMQMSNFMQVLMVVLPVKRETRTNFGLKISSNCGDDR